MATMTDVAAAFRAKLEPHIALAVIPSFAANRLPEVPSDRVLHFITGALEHQERVQSADSKVFPATILRVERIRRTTDDKQTLGEKAAIVMRTTDEDKNDQEETIYTHWVSFLGSSDPATVSDKKVAFEMALSQSIEADCRALIGQEAYVTKAFITGLKLNKKGDAVRFIADVRPKKGSTPASEASAGPQQNSHTPNRAAASSTDITEDVIRGVCSRDKIRFHPDLLCLTRVGGSLWRVGGEALAEEIARVFDITEAGEVDKFVDAFMAAEGKSLPRALTLMRTYLD